MSGGASVVFCVHAGHADAARQVTHLAVRHLLHEVLGPRVNVVSIAPSGDALGRAGLSTRTVYEIDLIGHGLVVCGETPALEVDVQALEQLDLPVLLCGLAAAEGVAGIDGWGPAVQSALLRRSVGALAAESRALEVLRVAGGSAALGGHPALFVERVPSAAPGEAARPARGGVLLVVRDPATMDLTDARRAAVREDVRTLVRRLRDRGHQDVRLLCQGAGDLRFAAAFGDLQLAYVEDPYAWLGEVRAAELVVTWRLEAALVRATAAQPFVHLAADGWERRALRDVGLGDWTVDLRDDAVAGAEAVLERVGRLDAQTDDRLAALARWAELDRHTATAFGDFARAVRAVRDDARRRRRAHIGLPEAPASGGLIAEATAVEDVSIIDETMLEPD